MPNLEKMPSMPPLDADSVPPAESEKAKIEDAELDEKAPEGDRELSEAEKREAAMELFKEIKQQIEAIMKELGDDSDIIDEYQKRQKRVESGFDFGNQKKLIIADRLVLRLQLEGILDWMSKINQKRSPDINDIKFFARGGESFEDLKNHKHALYIHGERPQKRLNRAVYSLIRNAEKLAAM